jgi:putative ABC transport system permease protein
LRRNRLVLFFVKRYLRFDREQPFISLSAILAFIGIALGVMVLIIAMSIMNGFDKELQRKLSIMNYPLTIISYKSNFVSDEVLQNVKQHLPELVYSPYLVSSIVTKYGQEMSGGFLFGIDFNEEKKINPVVQKSLKNAKDDESKYSVLIGETLQNKIGIGSGEKLTYIFTEIDPTGLLSTPKIKRFKIISTFTSGLSSYDESYSYTSLPAMQRILGLKKNQYHGIHIFSENPQVDKEKILKVLPEGYKIVGWWEQNGNLFSALEMEKRALFIVLMLIILIASVNIISSLLMTVMNRRSEIALLVSMGATEKEIRRIFLYLGIAIGIGGVFLGIGLGFLGNFILSNFDIISLPADIYGSSKLPLDLGIFDFSSIVIGAFVIVVLSAIYPSYRAGNIDIIKVLKNE